MPADPVEALKWYRVAAAQDEPDALLRLAEAARDGTLGQARNDAEAEKLFRRAAQHGQPVALLDLGMLRETGGGNKSAALRVYLEAARNNVPEACDRLGRAYRDGELGLTVDDVEARTWFKKAADLGDAEAN